VADIFDSYQLAAAWDEMFEAPGLPRRPYQALLTALQPLAPSELRYRADQMASAFTDRGVTFDYAGEERPFPLDLIPRMIEATQWDHITRGVRQRVLTLEAFLADVYGAGQVLADGVIPWRVVFTSHQFRREAVGISPPNGVRVHVAGIDLVRDEQGEFRVLEDNVRVPSGVSYVLENRLAMTRIFPALFAEQHVNPVDEYPARLLAALRAAASERSANPVIVVLTPGVHNAAYFEHALLARLMGVELVEGRDLVCVGNKVFVHTTHGNQPVDVIYRRIDDDFLDPLHFLPGSVIGCPGLVNAARAGNVAIANAVGNGVADDKLLYTYMPDLIRYYLNEEPILPNVESYRLEDPDVLDWVLSRLDQLVLKPVDGAGGNGIVIGPHADERILAALGAQVAAEPRNWMAQRPVALSTSPVLVGEHLVPRHIDLRPFAVNDGTSVWLLPGGLTRVALADGALVVNSSQGGGSKDTWILADERLAAAGTPRPMTRAPLAPAAAALGRQSGPAPGHEQMSTGTVPRTGLLSRIAETIFWTGRYIERADDTARMVDVYVHRMLEEPQADEDAGCSALLAALGLASPDNARLDIGTALEQLAYDQKSPSAIAGAMLAARSGGRSVREVISSEMWECLNVTALGLPRQRKAAERLGPHIYLQFIRERAALFFGLADSTMSHDDAWRFLVLGRSVERVDMTARMLLARLPFTAPDDLRWPTLLHACGAYESFIRTSSWTGGSGKVAEFLMLDRQFPRSVVHALATAEECLAALDPSPAGDGLADLARRPIGRARAELEYADPQLLHDRLADLLIALQQSCLEASEAITQRYFTSRQPVEWERGA